MLLRGVCPEMWACWARATACARSISLFCLFSRGGMEVERIRWWRLGAFFFSGNCYCNVYKDVSSILSEAARSTRHFNLIPFLRRGR
jgi:hypothetical protein